MQPEEISKDEFLNIDEENDSDKWWRCPRDSVIGKKKIFILKNKNLRDISPLSKFKDKMLEADSNLQRSITLFQGIEKMLALYKLYERRM